MDNHCRVGIVAWRHFLDSSKVFQVEKDYPGSSENGYLRLSRIEACFFEYSTSFDEVCLRCCFWQSMDRYNLIFFAVIRYNCQKIVSFCPLKFNMTYIVSPKLKPNSQTLPMLWCVVFIKDPIFDLANISCYLGFFNLVFTSLHLSFRVFPHHQLKCRSMAESNQIIDWPINTENLFFVLLLPKRLTCLTLPYND